MKEITCVVYNFDSNNGMKISKDVFQKAIDEYNKKEQKLGEMGIKTETQITLGSVSHTIEKLEIEGDDVVCKANLLDTDNGKIAQNLTNAGYPLKMEPRVVAEPIYETNENGEPDYSKIIGYENPEIISVDIVY